MNIYSYVVYQTSGRLSIIKNLDSPSGRKVSTSIMEVDMPYWKKLIDEMTSDERFRRVVEILTRASVRLLEKQRAETAAREKGEPVVPGNALTEPEESKKLDFTAPEIYEPEPRRGRIPFGRRRDGPRIKGNEIEMSLIKDIQRLAA